MQTNYLGTRDAVLRACVLLILVSPAGMAAQTLTREAVEAHMNAWYAAWASNDPEAIAKVDPPARGFGFRPLAPRSPETPLATHIERLKAFFGTMEYFRVRLDELHTAVDGDVGLAWGFHTEDFRVKGQAPERVRVRFTITLKNDRGAWRTLLYHRDIQPFDEQGRYQSAPAPDPGKRP